MNKMAMEYSFIVIIDKNVGNSLRHFSIME